VTNWDVSLWDLEYRGRRIRWSKAEEWRKVVDLPVRTSQRLELATELVNVPREDRALFRSNGWHLVEARPFSADPFGPYRDYIRRSFAELTVAKDQNVQLRSGWFSERSACYLAAGRPVVTQDTGFGTVLPTGEGLFAFTDREEAVAAVGAIRSDHARHSRAANEIAREYFDAGKVLAKLLADLGL
jgi:hypothetical protein